MGDCSYPNIFLNSSSPRSNKCERDWSRSDVENFVLDYLSVDWEDLSLVSNMNVKKIKFKTFLEKFDSLPILL